MDQCTPARVFTLQEQGLHWATVKFRNQSCSQCLGEDVYILHGSDHCSDTTVLTIIVIRVLGPTIKCSISYGETRWALRSLKITGEICV